MLDEMRQEHEQVKVDHIRIQQQLNETNSRVRDMEELRARLCSSACCAHTPHSRALLLFRSAQRSFALPPKKQQQTTAPLCLRLRIQAKTNVGNRRQQWAGVLWMLTVKLEAFRYPIDGQDADDRFRYEWSAFICDRYAFFMRVFKLKYANFFRQLINQSSDWIIDARFHHFFYRLLILSVEPPILATYHDDVNPEWLYLAIIRFNMQAAILEFLREPGAIRLDVPRFVNCEIVDNLVCVFRANQPAYFASYKFDECWQLVDRQVHLSAEANI